MMQVQYIIWLSCCFKRMNKDREFTESKTIKQNTKMKKHNPAKVLVSIAAVAVVAAGGWAFANRTPTIDVSKYMTLSADGYNTVGKLNIDFDTDKPFGEAVTIVSYGK